MSTTIEVRYDCRENGVLSGVLSGESLDHSAGHEDGAEASGVLELLSCADDLAGSEDSGGEDSGLLELLESSMDYRALILHRLDVFELTKLRSVNRALRGWATTARSSSTVDLGEGIVLQWLRHSPTEPAPPLAKMLPWCSGAGRVDLAAFGKGAVSGGMLADVARHCPLLRQLEAPGGDVCDEAVLSLGSGSCPLLQRVVLSENPIGDAAIQALANCQHLTELEAEATGMTDAGAIVLLGANPNLEKLNAAYCHRFSDAGARRVAERGGALRELNLTCTGVTSAGVRAVCASCPLAVLRVDQCEIEDDALQLAATSGRLSVLTVGQCTAVTDNLLHVLGEHSPQLRRLDLWGLPLITDDGLAEIARGCPSLRHLDASRCAAITDAGLCAIAAGCASLEHLAFASCRAGTETLLAVGQRCQQLRHLNANYSRPTSPRGRAPGGGRVSDEGLGAVAAGCPELRHVEVCSSGIGDTALLSLARSCPRLNHVDFSACPRVSDTGVVQLAQSCPELKDVYLGGCAVTDSSVAALQQGCPKLHYLFISCTNTSAAAAESPTARTGGTEPLHIHR